MTAYDYPPTFRAAELDKDLAELNAWYTEHHGGDFHMADNTADVNQWGVGRDTSYPLPDSHINPPSVFGRKKPERTDYVTYQNTAAALRKDGYVSLYEASEIVGLTKMALKSDAKSGYLVTVTIPTYNRKSPSCFVSSDELKRYMAWRDDGRPRADKYKVNGKKGGSHV